MNLHRLNEWWGQSFLGATGLSVGLAILIGIGLVLLLRGRR